jgi:hypothetical protein
MPRKGPPQEPPRDARNEELGGKREERNRHLSYAHEQYSASGQGRFGAPKGRKLPLQKPSSNQGHYPRGTRLPWPADETLATDRGSDRRRRS